MYISTTHALPLILIIQTELSAAHSQQLFDSSSNLVILCQKENI